MERGLWQDSVDDVVDLELLRLAAVDTERVDSDASDSTLINQSSGGLPGETGNVKSAQGILILVSRIVLPVPTPASTLQNDATGRDRSMRGLPTLNVLNGQHPAQLYARHGSRPLRRNKTLTIVIPNLCGSE
jgi:hypothetical protein